MSRPTLVITCAECGGEAALLLDERGRKGAAGWVRVMKADHTEKTGHATYRERFGRYVSPGKAS